MKCFKVDRVDYVEYGEDDSMVVIAENEKDAEKHARIMSSDFKNAPLKVQEIDMNKKQFVLIATR